MGIGREKKPVIGATREVLGEIGHILGTGREIANAEIDLQ